MWVALYIVVALLGSLIALLATSKRVTQLITEHELRAILEEMNSDYSWW